VTLNAILLKFAYNESTLKPDDRDLPYCFRIYTSADNKKWKLLVDKSNNTVDACHDYIVLDKPVKTKYLKIENVKVPSGKFSIYDFRVFGMKEGNLPAEVKDLVVARDSTDTRKSVITWTKDGSATGYVVNYGIEPGKLYTSFMVYDANSVEINALNKDVPYFFSIDSFNESGITKGATVIQK
jgi:hypothetical protein